MKYLKNKIFTTEKEFDKIPQPFVVETIRRHALEGHFLSLIQSSQDPNVGRWNLFPGDQEQDKDAHRPHVYLPLSWRR